MTNAKHFNSLINNVPSFKIMERETREALLMDPDEVYMEEAPHWWSTFLTVVAVISFCALVWVVVG